MTNNAMVFDAYQGHLDQVHEQTLGFAVLALDTPADLIGSMATLADVLAWEIQTENAAGYERGSAEVVYALEPDDEGNGNAGVVRYATSPPTFDLAGADETTGQPNATVAYLDEGDPEDCPLVFANHVEQGDGFNGWSPDEHPRGLARVARATSTVPPGGATGHALLKASDADGDTEWGEVAGGGGTVETFLGTLLGVAEVDGTATTFEILAPSPGATGSGVVPDGFVSVFTIPDVATFEGLLAFQGLTTAKVIVPDRVPAYEFPATAIDEPWIEVPANTAVNVVEGEEAWAGVAGATGWRTLHPWSTAAGDKVVSTGDPGVTVDSADDGVTINSADDGVTIDSADDGVTIRSSDPNVTIDADDVEFIGSGLMYGTTQAGPALRNVEGKLDGHRDVSTAFTGPVPDLATLMAGPVDDIDQPTGIDGRQVQKGDLVATLGDVDVDGEGWIKVVDIDTGQWGDVPSSGPSTPAGAAVWDNAITTNYLRGGDKIVLDSGAIGTFRAYRTNGVDTWVRGGPSVFAAPFADGQWVFTAAGFDHADAAAAHAAIEAATDHAELTAATAAAFALVAGITP